jgi:DNA-binding transcriptional ArsR family regulator
VSLALVFGRDDPARVRFAISPVWETMSALRVLLEPHRRRYHLPWLESVRPHLSRLDLWPLLALSPRSGWTPDFLSPAPAVPDADIADQLAQVRATTPGQVAREVKRSLTQRSGDPPPEAAWGLLDDPAATRDLLADLLGQCWRLLIAPYWPGLRDLLQADTLYRAQLLGDYGLERVLGDLHPGARWTGRTMIIERPGTERHRLAGAGLLLVPSVFVWPSLVAVTDPPSRPALVYPARGIAELWQPARTRHSDALARLLGRTRAALLESLAEPASTRTLARRHGLAPSTVSGHLGTLHGARLITRRRHRHEVVYQQTRLGAGLAHGGTHPAGHDERERNRPESAARPARAEQMERRSRGEHPAGPQAR